MRKLHLAVGISTVVVFIITGQIMHFHQPPLKTLGGAERMMFRSRHIYILASGLVNLMLGIYLKAWDGWRRSMQRIGAALLVVSPVLLILAFRHDPRSDPSTHHPLSAFGLYALFAGCILHFISSLGRTS